MIFDEDSEPKNKKPALRVLDKMSVAELQEYAAALDAEKLRVQTEIERKQKHLSAMDALFGGKTDGAT
ncbi:MAG: DUF1192 domain-containing protein [Alphaproteobacteria bacterium]|nr:DUF1192 domain-containing protein [Alphaproteobacteria bacterium]HRI75930.1 DUF1192 family protein [Alphaproteobacteria bacterium]